MKKEGTLSMLFEIINIILLILTVASCILAVVLKDLLACAIALAAMSLLLSLEFYILQAPDVAIAEAGVGACLSTAIMIVAIKGTKRMEEEYYMSIRNIVAVVMLSILAVFFVLTALMLSFGAPIKYQMDDYIIMHTQNETGTNSAVTTIVFDYRGFDTLGEATILFAAVSGVLMIFRRIKK